jgi:hypothetical protein
MPYFCARFSAVMAMGCLAEAVGERAAEGVFELAGRGRRRSRRGRRGDVGRLGHVLGAAHEHGLGLAEEELLGAVDDGLKARAAEAVDGERGHGDGQPALEAHVARAVDRVGGGLLDVAEDHVAESLFGGDAGVREGGLGGVHGEVRGAHALERARDGAERGAAGGRGSRSHETASP